MAEDGDLDGLRSWAAKMSRRPNARAFAQEGCRDRVIVEVDTAREWARSMHAGFGIDIVDVRASCEPAPDCLATFAGSRISIEMKELIDGDQMGRLSASGGNVFHGKGFDDAQWDVDRFFDFLNRLIEKAEARYAKSNFDVLLIYSGEQWLIPNDVELWLSSRPITTVRAFRHVSLVLTYDPAYSRTLPLFVICDDMFGIPRPRGSDLAGTAQTAD